MDKVVTVTGQEEWNMRLDVEDCFICSVKAYGGIRKQKLQLLPNHKWGLS